MANPQGNLKPGRKKTGGRQKGVTNKVNRELKDMILGALDDAGGQSYLAARAIDCPGAFLTLVGKCLPKEAPPSQEQSVDFVKILELMSRNLNV